MKLIILNITNYKEKDAIITGFNNEEVVSFTARGILDNKAKNIVLKNPLIEADVSFVECNSKYPTLRNSALIFSPYKMDDSLEKMAALAIIQESLNKMLLDEEKVLVYEDTKEALIALKENKSDIYQILISFLTRLLKVSGTYFEINSCVNCGNKKDIVAFNFDEGGFLCNNCLTSPEDKYFSVNELIIIRKLFSSKTYLPLDIKYSKDELFKILTRLIHFIDDAIGSKIKTFELLK